MSDPECYKLAEARGRVIDARVVLGLVPPIQIGMARTGAAGEIGGATFSAASGRGNLEVIAWRLAFADVTQSHSRA